MFDNLFTDMYDVVYRMYGGKTKEERIYDVQDAVKREVETKSVPDKLRYLFIKISNYCNSDCEYCMHAVSRNKMEKKNEISTELAMKVIKEACDLGVHTIILSGGEPLLRDDIYDLIAYIKSRGIVPGILTNGTLLDTELPIKSCPDTHSDQVPKENLDNHRMKIWERLGEAGIGYITISFDSATREIYEKHRGISFDMAVSGINAAMKLREKYPHVEVHVSAVLARDNQEDFLKLVEYLTERRIAVQISPLHDFIGNSKDNLIFDRDDFERFTQRVLDMKRNGSLISSSEEFIKHLPRFFCDNKRLPENFACKIGYSALYIDAYMNVRTCWDDKIPPIGNIKENTLQELWFSDDMQKRRERMLKCQCTGCWYMCTAEITLLFDDIENRGECSQ